MLIAFRCYDVDFDEVISEEEVSLVLKHIPFRVDGLYGHSFDEEPLSHKEYMFQKKFDED